MRKLVVLLSLTTALFAGTTAYLYFHSDELPARPHDDVLADASPTPVPMAATQTPAATVQSALASKAAAKESPRSHPGDFERVFLERESDPARRAQLLEETRIGLRREYPALDRVSGFDAVTYEQLVSLLAEQRIEAHKAGIECKYASTCGTGLTQLRKVQQADLATLLGPDGKQRFEQYLESRSERLMVNSMRGRLTDKSQLPDSQAEELTSALADERQRIEIELSQRGETQAMTFDGMPLVYLPATTYENLMEQARAYQERLRTRAASLLTPAQLAVYDQMVAEKMIVVGAMVQSTVDNQAKVAN